MEIYEKETVTTAEMKTLEHMAADAGLSYYQMMENAGTKAAALIDENRPAGNLSPEVLVLCGKGNNGGDGFVAARILQEKGWNGKLILIEGMPKTEDALKNYELIQGRIGEISSEDAVRHHWDAVVDSIYGTGFHGSLRTEGLEAVELIGSLGSSGAKVYALDIPSGLPGDMTPEYVPQQAVRADYTITFHAKKTVHDQPGAAEYLGQVITADIGIADVLKDRQGRE